MGISNGAVVLGTVDVDAGVMVAIGSGLDESLEG